MRRRPLILWVIWVLGFYAVWLWIVNEGRLWEEIAAHWGIAVSMAVGSYVAGATPMGGGTVGFPILVLFFNEPATLGRDFSFAVQSIGMTSATIFIFLRRQPVEWRMVRWAMVGSLVGTPLGILFVAPHVPNVLIMMTFAVVWASFGILHLLRLRDFVKHNGLAPVAKVFDRVTGLSVGFFAGLTVASITGVGIDMVLYCLLVLLCQADLKIAIPSSVVIMAFTSLIGVATKSLTGGLQPGVYENWLAAAPIVILGAPLGAFVVDHIGRSKTLYLVSVLCIGQFAWTLIDKWSQIGIGGALAMTACVALLLVVFNSLYKQGEKLNRRGRIAFGATA